MPRAKFETDEQFNSRNTRLSAIGVTAGTTDNTGSLVITHALASAPTFVSATVLGTTQGFFTITNRTATGSTLRLFGTGSGALTSTVITASWMVAV